VPADQQPASPTLEIMLPYYGPVGLLQAAVRSVLAQQDPQWTLTVVDDAYPDRSVAAWLADLHDERVRYLRNEVNLGVNQNFQRCLDLVTRDLVVIIGGDDLLLPNYVGTVRDAHTARPAAAVIQPGVQVIDGAGRPARTLVDEVKRRVYAPKPAAILEMAGEDLAVSLLRGNWLYFPSLCWRVSAIGETRFRPGLDTIQDLALVIDLIMAGESLLVVPTTCFQYRRHAGSESSLRAEHGSRFQEERRFFLDVAHRATAQSWLRAARTARLHLSSRLHALSVLPGALRRRDSAAIARLTRHVVGSARGAG